MTSESHTDLLGTQTEQRESFEQVVSLRSLGIIGAVGFMIGTMLILCKYCRKKQKELVVDHSANAVEFNEESTVSSPLLRIQKPLTNVFSAFDEHEYHSRHTKCKNGLQEVRTYVPKSLLFFQCPAGIRSLKNTSEVLGKKPSILGAQGDSETTSIVNIQSTSDTDVEDFETHECFTKFKYLENIPTNGDFKPIYQDLIRSALSSNTSKVTFENQTKVVDTYDSRVSDGTRELTVTSSRLEPAEPIHRKLRKVEFATYALPNSDSVDFLENSEVRPEMPNTVTKRVFGWQECQPLRRTAWSGNCAVDHCRSVDTICTQFGVSTEEYCLREKENMRPSWKQLALQNAPPELTQTLNNQLITQPVACDKLEELITVKRFQLTVTKLTRKEQQTDSILEELSTERRLSVERLITQTENSETILSPDSMESPSLPCISIVSD